MTSIHASEVFSRTDRKNPWPTLFMRYAKRLLALLVLLCQLLPLAHAVTDTGLAGDDRAAGPFPIGFEFVYYGNTYTNFYASTNGLLQFANPTNAYSNTCLDNGAPRSTIFVFWDDLRTDASGQVTGTIKYETIGDAPNRQLIVQWTNMYYYGSNLPMGTFQAVLSEGSGDISLNYRFLMDVRATGESATIGIASSGPEGIQIGCEQADAIHPEQSIALSPDGAGGYTVNPAAPYVFHDISGLIVNDLRPSARYAGGGPEWVWSKNPSLNQYEIEIQNDAGVTVQRETLGSVGTYRWAAGWEEGVNYRARIRGSINQGGTWELWSSFSAQTAVDITPPVTAISSIRQIEQTGFDITYQAQDSLSGMSSARISIAPDAGFSNILYSQVFSGGGRTVQFATAAPPEKIHVKLEATDLAGNAATPRVVEFAVMPPPRILAPTAGEALGRLPYPVRGLAFPNAQVALYLDQTLAGYTTASADGSYGYALPAPLTEGTHTLHASASYQGSTSGAGAAVAFTYTRPPGPNVQALLGGVPLDAGPITQPGLLAITAQSPVGVARIQASVNGAALYSQTYANTPTATASQFIDFAQLPNGVHTLAITATDADSGQTLLTIPFTLDMSAPPAPAITAPAGGAKVSVPQVGVAGTAQPGASVQLYLNGQSTGNPLAASASGAFSGQVTLAEGTHQLSARASNSRGQGPVSSAVAVTYAPSVPTVVFVNPPEGAVLSANTTLEVSALDAGGIAKVEFLANGQPLATRTSAPWSVSWPAATLADGAYTLQAIATNTAGKTAQASRSVQVQKVVPPPPPPPPPYVARSVTATPALSFGQSSVQIQGEAVSSEGAQPMPNAALRMVLRVQGFERRFNLVSDAAGRFAYTFAPQANDAGSYEVRVIHPDVTTYAKDAPQAVFTINRLGVNYAQYTLNAIRGFASTAQLSVTASSGTGATGVHWQALAADQPSGALPPGITLDLGSPVNIAAGTSAPVNIQLTGGPGAGESGTILLKLFATESGSQPRAELRLDYRLHEARPGLTPSPTALELGVQQGKSISGKLTLTNKGYAPAQNVQVALQARGGGAAPAWVSLDSAPDIGAIDLGQSALVQITARPGTDVADGYHQLQLRISAANDAGGTVPITIAVARDGQGTARFKLVDIYTGTLDAQGQPIEGLAGARITLQNEALTGDIRSATSNAQGIAEYTAIPPGNYRWRASAPSHQDASGRLTVYPGVTANERVFLDYQVVSIEFSVTETTIKDEYAIVLEATYQTQVPAPVVLLEPMSISLPALQQGEEHTGELTLSNYGLVRADNLQYALPASDANYKYEYFGQLPTQLAAKSRVSIPYRITALQALKSGVALNLAPAHKLEQLTSGKPPQPAGPVQNAIRAFLRTGDSQAIDKTASSAATVQAAAKAASCSSYQTQGCVAYDYDCAAGDKRSGSACSSISRVTGSGCSGPSSSGGGGPTSGIGDVWGGGTWAAGGAMPLTPACIAPCQGPVCQCRRNN